MAFVLSSVSGNLISAASAGYAPTNGGDVSAIASAYQVVSATGTQLYAGTAFLTGVNGAPISADRAGQAANASLANSAWYDGTGRIISALPDSAAVSAIASAYAESAASSKQDTLSFSYDDDKISAINGSALAGQGGLITSVDSALDPWYREAISGLNGSSIYPKWAESAKSANYASTAGYATNAHSAGAAPTAWASSFITGVSSPSGTIRVLCGTAIETTNSAVLPSMVIDGFSVVGVGAGSTNTTSFTVPESNPTTRVHFGDAYAYGTFTIDTDNSIHKESSLDGGPMDVWFDLPYATSFTATYPWATNVGYTASASAYEDGGGVGELAWASALPSYSYDGSGNISAINGSAIGGQGGVDSATVSAIASAYVESGVSSKLDASASSSFYSTANESGFITGVSSPSGTIYVVNGTSSIEATNSAVALEQGDGFLVNLGRKELSPNMPFTVTLPSANPNTTIIVPMDWGTPDSCEVIARWDNGDVTATIEASSDTAYLLTPNATSVDLYSNGYRSMEYGASASASASGAMSPVGIGELAWASALPSYSYDGSGNISAINGSAIGGQGGYIPTSMSSDFQPVTGMSSYALSADVSATVDLVGTQSANWGGSALALSAGPGVKLEMSGNTLVASTDETVLWSTSTYNANISSITLSEPASAFEVVRIMDSKNHVQDYYPKSGTSAVYFVHNTYTHQWETFWSFCSDWSGISGNEGWLADRSGAVVSGGQAIGPAAPYGRWITPMKIVGINRTAGV